MSAAPLGSNFRESLIWVKKLQASKNTKCIQTHYSYESFFKFWNDLKLMQFYWKHCKKWRKNWNEQLYFGPNKAFSFPHKDFFLYLLVEPPVGGLDHETQLLCSKVSWHVDSVAVQDVSREEPAWWVLLQLQKHKVCVPTAAGICARAPVPKAGHCLMYVNGCT